MVEGPVLQHQDKEVLYGHRGDLGLFPLS
jgi:hypothetical protein